LIYKAFFLEMAKVELSFRAKMPWQYHSLEVARDLTEPFSLWTTARLADYLAEMAVPRTLFAAILRRIDRLRGPSMAAA
jgi:hypothetical protein